MPMDVEICRTCGCTEFQHEINYHDDECEEDCEADHDDRSRCACGRCEEVAWLDEPDQLVCDCGCADHAHTDDGCETCDCREWREFGTAADFIRAELDV